MVLPEFEASGERPLYQQLYGHLRGLILQGQLLPGTRLPATRDLARDLGVSRNTVVSGFEQLLAEGYLEARVGDGTYVAHDLPERFLYLEKAAAQPQLVSSRSLSKRGERMAQTPVTSMRKRSLAAFRMGLPDFSLFPWELWSSLEARHWRRFETGLYDYADPAGYLPLREAVAQHLITTRGVRCEPQQVLIIQGSQQGLDLTARMLLDPGDAVWVEDPGYLGAKAAFLGAAAQLIPVPVDREGLQVETGRRLAPKARLAYVTPSHQYPLGLTLSLSRRLALLEWASESGAWVLEDDYDSHYRYSGRPLASLQGLDREARVIYLGTFSKVMMPGLRLGYLVVPPDLVASFTAGRALMDRHPPGPVQAVMNDFIREGHLARHIRRTRAVYAVRKGVLLEGLQQMQAAPEVITAQTGLHLSVWLPSLNDQKVSAAAAALGLEAQPLSAYSMQKTRSGLGLGFAAFTPEQIEQGLYKLAKVLK